MIMIVFVISKLCVSIIITFFMAFYYARKNLCYINWKCRDL